MRCEFCEEIKADVTREQDPIASEVGNRMWLVWICMDCYRDRASDV